MTSPFAFKKWNQISGWTIFAIALTTFSLTVEPTASYWDCGEYIATSAKLQVGHPPGAPLFQMLGAFFAMFALEIESIALMVNMMSVVASAFTILFLFWTSTLIIKKLLSKNEPLTTQQGVLILGSSAVGALAYTFSDSFWYNAVEAEVYAMATFLMALLFWLGLRWEQEMNTPRGDRWLVLISFVIGLSFGVHFMGLLAIPAIGMIYFFKNYPKVTVKSFVVANTVSIAILLFIFKLLLPLTLAFFGNAEVFFINTIGLPFNSGTVIAAIAFIAFFYYGIRYTRKKNWININTGLLCVLFILIGFSSWIMLPIRANANTVINENSPSDARLLLAYYNLEQYPDTHLFYGPMFSDMYAGQDPIKPYKDDKPKFERDEKKGKYIIVNDWENARINSNSAHEGFLPRMWSTEHAVNYMNYFEVLDFSIKPEYRAQNELVQAVQQFRSSFNQGDINAEEYHEFLTQFGAYLNIDKPSFLANIRYLLQHQMGYMYWRYFMWNFSGRQNDVKGEYDPLNGNWISGIDFIDSYRLGSQKNLPADVENNKARNTYYMLPLFFGVIGLLFLYNQDKKRFWVLLVLFLFTGLALKVYLNERPFEPRERDYALVGSFYVYALFIGLGVVSLFQTLKKYLAPKIATPLVIVSALLAVPVLMAYQNWDDHDRSNRYTAQSTAKAYLDSIDENVGALIFTIGDNDTFALWYAQEIEEYRTDVRSINTSLLGTDWYIDQTKRKTYESEPVKSQLIHRQYAYGVRDYIKHEPILDSVRWNINDFMNWVSSDNPRTRYKHLLKQVDADLDRVPISTQNLVYYPTNKIRVPVNKENVLKSGLVRPKDSDLIVDYIDIDLPKSGIYKNQLLMLDILANNDWERPIYFTGGSYTPSEYMWMKDYLQLEGLVYKLVPIKTEIDSRNPYEMGRIDSNRMYDIVMKWDWGNSGSADIYHDTETRKNSISFRGNLARLSSTLIEEKKSQKAEAVMDLAMEQMPIDYFGYYTLVEPFLEGYYRINKVAKAQNIFESLSKKYQESLTYFASISTESQYELGEQIITDLERYRSLVEMVVFYEDTEILKRALDDFINFINPVKHLYGDYEYYTLMTPFVEAYYSVVALEKGQNLYTIIATEYQKRLQLFADLPLAEMKEYYANIATEIEGYRMLVQAVKIYEKDSFALQELQNFNKNIEPFERLFTSLGK